MKNNNIGGYGISIKQKSKYLYRAQSTCEAYFLRAKIWLDLLNDEDTNEIAPIVMERLKKRYMLNIDKNLRKMKFKDLAIQAKRNNKETEVI